MIISLRLSNGVKHLLISLGVINKNGKSTKRCLNKMFNRAIRYYCVGNNLTDKYKLEQMLLIDQMTHLTEKQEDLVRSKKLIAKQLAKIRDKIDPEMHNIIQDMEGMGYKPSEVQYIMYIIENKHLYSNDVM